MTDELAPVIARIAHNTTTTPTGCHLWQGTTTPTGYGRIHIAGQAHLIHHITWHLRHGNTPRPRLTNMCGHRHCHNPEHWAKTPSEHCA